MNRSLQRRSLLASVWCVASLIWGLEQEELRADTTNLATVLGIQGTQFTINGRVAFLLGISYYGALGAPETVWNKDLADIKHCGFNWIRVWATWSGFSNNVSAVDASGMAREPFLTRLKQIVAQCEQAGIVVDITLSRGDGLAGSPHLQTLAAHRQAADTLVTALKPFRNWYLDLSNERNVRDKRFTSFEDLRELRELVRAVDPPRLVTASDGGDISRDDLRRYVETAQVDFIAPHRPRGPESPGQTRAKTAEYLSWMKEMSRVVPVHYQEPFRRGYNRWQPKASDFIIDAENSKTSGAAGWCFHNGPERGSPGSQPRRSFDLRQARLFDQFDLEEQKVLQGLRELLQAPRWENR